MDKATLLQELESLATQIDVEVRHEALAGPRGGLCRLGAREVILIDRNLPLTERVELMLEALSRLPLEDVFVPPAIRQILQERATGTAPMWQ